AVAFGELRQRVLEHRAAGGKRDPAWRHRPQGRRAKSALEQRSLTQDGARPDFGDRLAVDLDSKHAVEQEEQLGTGLALLDQRRSSGHFANLRLGATSHDLGGELPLERALNLGYKSRRVFSTPGGALAENVPRPSVEIRDGDLVDQPAGGVVDPMAREGGGAQDLVAGRAIRLEVQRQCRPDNRRDDLDKRGTVQLAGQRDRRTAARGLDEPN